MVDEISSEVHRVAVDVLMRQSEFFEDVIALARENGFRLEDMWMRRRVNSASLELMVNVEGKPAKVVGQFWLEPKPMGLAIHAVSALKRVKGPSDGERNPE